LFLISFCNNSTKLVFVRFSLMSTLLGSCWCLTSESDLLFTFRFRQFLMNCSSMSSWWTLALMSSFVFASWRFDELISIGTKVAFWSTWAWCPRQSWSWWRPLPPPSPSAWPTASSSERCPPTSQSPLGPPRFLKTMISV